jgi:hypothetical protein
MTVLDFADYRLRMRAGVPSSRRSYYLVGLTHAARTGMVDMPLRQSLAEAIRTTDPHAVVHDPLTAWRNNQSVPEFHRLTALAATSETCVAWLPTRETITDAAAELQTAHRANTTVVAITTEPDDFLIHAFATVVVPDLAAFTAWVLAA